MKQKIDLTGFINEDIELAIDDEVFLIPTDPDVESWVFLLNYISGTFNTEDIIEAQRKIIISLIVNNNKGKNFDIANLKKKLGATALENFMKSYTKILIDKGILKEVKKKINFPKMKKRPKKNQSN